jgi:hypothetical protein
MRQKVSCLLIFFQITVTLCYLQILVLSTYFEELYARGLFQQVNIESY